MQSTMQHSPLTVQTLFKHGASLHADREVLTFDGAGVRRIRFGDLARRVHRLAAALARLGVQQGERVGTFCWNCQEHVEAYFAVPCMGAVLHTLNIRLYPDQISYIVNHAENRVVIVEEALIPLLAPILDKLTCVRHFIVIGNAAAFPGKAHSYEELLAGEGSPPHPQPPSPGGERGEMRPPHPQPPSPGGERGEMRPPHPQPLSPGGERREMQWPDVEEASAAAMCYTSGTTGNPKGVVYSHRSIYLHSLACASASGFGLNPLDRALVLPSMFHANAWGIPHAGWWVGCDLILPGRFVQSEPLSRLIELTRPTFAGAVPTIWNDLVRFAETKPFDWSSLRLAISGGSAVPRSLIERMQKRHGARLVQIWGMTETGPLAAISHPPRACDLEEDINWRTKTGRILHGIELRIVDQGKVLPWDGVAIGEIEIRGPWVTASYYKDDAPEKFNDGWLRTGDVGAVDPLGYIQITDRAKDVVKSGGEWVSSVELENHIMAHPDVIEAAVIAVPDDRWDERPLACIVLKAGSGAKLSDVQSFLAARVVRWWLPERWAIIAEVPKTSVGKFDKKVLRARYASGELSVTVVGK